MRKWIKKMFPLLLVASVALLSSCGKDDNKESKSEQPDETVAPEGVRELTQKGVTAKIEAEEWGGGGTVLYVTVKLTKQDFNSRPRGEVFLQAKSTDGGVLRGHQSGKFGDYWNGKECSVKIPIVLYDNKKMKANSLTISKLQVL